MLSTSRLSVASDLSDVALEVGMLRKCHNVLARANPEMAPRPISQASLELCVDMMSRIVSSSS